MKALVAQLSVLGGRSYDRRPVLGIVAHSFVAANTMVWDSFFLACFLLKQCPSGKVHPFFTQTQLNEEI
jgi:hypothetical protein